MRHATIFTLRKEPQVIQIKEEGKSVVHENCLRCHESLYEYPKLSLYVGTNLILEQKSRDCMLCHRETPHGMVQSLSSVPNSRVPLPESAVPQWLNNIMNQKNKML